jgi:hypothetical protein
MRRRAEFLSALLLAAAGCASEGSPQDPESAPPPGYFAARGRELAQILQLELFLGPGLGARVSVTRHVQLGLLAVGPAEHEGHLLDPLSLAAGLREGEVGAWSLRTIEYGLSPWFEDEGTVRQLLPVSDASPRRFEPSDARDTSITAQVHLAIVGAEVGFDPGALVRFVVGLFGFGEGGFFD